MPCTPAGVIRLLEEAKVTIAGAHAVVIGRSDIVGSPVCALLRSKDATVTQCHSKTKNLPEIVSLKSVPCLSLEIDGFFQIKTADIVVAAMGKALYVQGSWLKPGATVIDVGTNYILGTLSLWPSQITYA